MPSPDAATGGLGRAVDLTAGFVTALALWIGVAFLGLMTALVVIQVVARNAFDLGLPWADELARYSGIALVYLALPWLALRGRHICVDILVNLAPTALRRALLIAGEVLMILFAAVTLYALDAFLARAGKFTTSALSMPNTWFYAPATAGMLLLALASALRAVRLASGPLPEPGVPSEP